MNISPKMFIVQCSIAISEREFHMRFRFGVAIMITIALSAIPGAAQTPKAPAKAWTPPRLPDGHPDLQGIWNYSTLTPVERPKELADKPFFTEQEAAAYQKRLMQTRNVIWIVKPLRPLEVS